MSRYDREDDGYYRQERHGDHLQPPSLHSRPRSMPPVSSTEIVRGGPVMSPATTRYESRSRSRSREDRHRSRHRHHHHHHDPIEKAEHALKHTFTTSNSGIGVGILGAVVGGLTARHITEASSIPSSSSSSSRRRQHDKDRDARLLVSTLLGAAVGGLGANALERRIEHSRDKKLDEEDEERWRGRDRRSRRTRPPRDDGGLNSDYYRGHPDGRGAWEGPDHVYDTEEWVSERRIRRSEDGRRPAGKLEY